MPGLPGLAKVGLGAFADWTPAAENPESQYPTSPLLPNSSFTRHKSLEATSVDMLTGTIYEGIGFLPKKTLPKLTQGQINFIDISGIFQEKAMNRIIRSGLKPPEENE